jgi:hypothetical protein
MKALSGTFAFIGLAVVLFLFGCRVQKVSTSQPFDTTIGDPDANPPRYVELKDGLAGEPNLRVALAKIKKHGGVCKIYFLRHDGEQPDREYSKHIDVSLQTDSIIKSEVATNAARDSSAANDPNVAHRIASPNPTDISGVLDLLK